jgi:hypothetical protein
MKTWEKTRERNLVRHKSGRYYARTFNNNKEIWKSLRTAHFSVAKVRLAEFLREHRESLVPDEPSNSLCRFQDRRARGFRPPRSPRRAI